MHIVKPCSQHCGQRNITTSLFDAGLKCMTKYYLRSQGETRAGNAYAHWVMDQMKSYREGGIRSLTVGAAHDDCIIDSPGMSNLKGSKWQLAVNLVVSAKNLESSLHAVERVPAQGRASLRSSSRLDLLSLTKLPWMINSYWHSIRLFCRR